MYNDTRIVNKRDIRELCCQKLITEIKEAVAGKMLNQPFQVRSAETQAHPKNKIRNGLQSILRSSMVRTVPSLAMPIAPTAAPERFPAIP